jgi:ribosomal protein L11
MDTLTQNKSLIAATREKLRNKLLEKVDQLSSSDWDNIKKFKIYFCRDISMNKIVPDFRITSPVQVSGSEEEKKLTFLEVRRLLCYLLVGNDYMKVWKSTDEEGFGEALSKEVINKIKEIAETKLPDLNTKKLDSAMRIIEGTAKNMGITILD